MLKRKRRDNSDYDFRLLRTWVNDKLTHGHTSGADQEAIPENFELFQTGSGDVAGEDVTSILSAPVCFVT